MKERPARSRRSTIVVSFQISISSSPLSPLTTKGVDVFATKVLPGKLAAPAIKAQSVEKRQHTGISCISENRVREAGESYVQFGCDGWDTA